MSLIKFLLVVPLSTYLLNQISFVDRSDSFSGVLTSRSITGRSLASLSFYFLFPDRFARSASTSEGLLVYYHSLLINPTAFYLAKHSVFSLTIW